MFNPIKSIINSIRARREAREQRIREERERNRARVRAEIEALYAQYGVNYSYIIDNTNPFYTMLIPKPQRKVKQRNLPEWW